MNSKIIEIEIEDVDFEIQVDDGTKVVENEKYQYDKKLRTCVKRNNS